MKTPELICNVKASCLVNPSENLDKIKTSILNVFSDIEISKNDYQVEANSDKIETLSRIYEIIHSQKKQHTYRRILNQNLSDDATWFYLNKQAAFVNVIALCNDDDESPLGPIKIVLSSHQIEDVIDWLTSD